MHHGVAVFESCYEQGDAGSRYEIHPCGEQSPSQCSFLFMLRGSLWGLCLDREKAPVTSTACMRYPSNKSSVVLSSLVKLNTGHQGTFRFHWTRGDTGALHPSGHTPGTSPPWWHKDRAPPPRDAVLCREKKQFTQQRNNKTNSKQRVHLQSAGQEAESDDGECRLSPCLRDMHFSWPSPFLMFPTFKYM